MASGARRPRNSRLSFDASSALLWAALRSRPSTCMPFRRLDFRRGRGVGDQSGELSTKLGLERIRFGGIDPVQIVAQILAPSLRHAE